MKHALATRTGRISIFYSRHFATPPFLKTCQHVRSARLAPRKLVGLTFGLSLKTYKCNPVMMFARRFHPPSPLDFLSLSLLSLPASRRLLTDRRIYSKSSQLSYGNSISSKNDPVPSSRPRSSPCRIAERAMANGKSALNRPEISSGEISPDF